MKSLDICTARLLYLWNTTTRYLNWRYDLVCFIRCIVSKIHQHGFFGIDQNWLHVWNLISLKPFQNSIPNKGLKYIFPFFLQIKHDPQSNPNSHPLQYFCRTLPINFHILMISSTNFRHRFTISFKRIHLRLRSIAITSSSIIL